MRTGTVAAQPVDVRARERILSEGTAALTDEELLGALLGSGGKGRTAAVIAESLLGSGLPALCRGGAAGLLSAEGVGEAQAARVLAAFELGRRALQRSAAPRRLAGPGEIAAALWPRLAHLPHEEFWAVLLSARLEEKRSVRVAMGGLTSCSILPREAFRASLLFGAPAVAFAHNHPSGDPTPSAEDHRLQLLLDEAGRALGVQVVDHLVIAERGSHSARAGLLKRDEVLVAG